MNRKLISILSSIICILLVATMVVGCSSNKNDNDDTVVVQPTNPPMPADLIAQVTMSGYRFEEKSSNLTDFIAKFNSKYPGVDVTVQWDDVTAKSYFDELDGRVEAGTIGSVFLVDSSRIAEYVSKGYIINLDDYIGDLYNFDTYNLIDPSKDLLQAAFTASRYDGHTYMAAIEYNHKFIFLNVSMLEEAGLSFPKDTWSWDDLVSMAKTLVENGHNTPIAMDYSDYAIWGAFARSGGAKLFDNIGTSDKQAMNLTDPTVIAGLEYLASIVDPSENLVDCVDASNIKVEDLSKYAFIVADHENIAEWKDYIVSSDCPFEWDYIHFPRWNTNKENMTAAESEASANYYQAIGASVYGFAVYNYGKDDTHNDEYYKSCAYLALTSMVQAASAAYASDGESVPANKNANEQKFWREFPVKGKNSSVFSNFADIADFSADLSSFMPLTSSNEVDMGSIIDDVIGGKITMQVALQLLQDKINASWAY